MNKILLLAAAALAFSGCVTVGRPVVQGKDLPTIEINKTTRTDIQKIFGDPNMSGIEDGDETWTYLDLHVSFFSLKRAEDLQVRFNKDNTVHSYNYNSNR